MHYNDLEKRTIIASGDNFIIVNRGNSARHVISLAVAFKEDNERKVIVLSVTRDANDPDAPPRMVSLASGYNTCDGDNGSITTFCDNPKDGAIGKLCHSHLSGDEFILLLHNKPTLHDTSAPAWAKNIESRLLHIAEQHPEVLKKSSASTPANKEIQARLLAPIIEELKKHEPQKGQELS